MFSWRQNLGSNQANELEDRQFEASPDRDEPPSFKPAGDEPGLTRTVSEGSTGERVFHFGCYPSATRFDLERKMQHRPTPVMKRFTKGLNDDLKP